MTPNEIVIKAARALDRANIPFMLVGAFSANVHGVPRDTYDADFLIQLESTRLNDLVRHLAPDFRFDPQLSFESVSQLTHYYKATHIDPSFDVDFFIVSDEPHDRLQFQRRQSHLLQGQPVSFMTAEDLIITKLRWSKSGRRHKDIDDARNVLAVQQGKLDLTYIRQWCSQHGTLALLETTLQSIPSLPP